MPADDFDPEFRRGIMNMTDAARYLAVSQQTFHRWARGYQMESHSFTLRTPPTFHTAHWVSGETSPSPCLPLCA